MSRPSLVIAVLVLILVGCRPEPMQRLGASLPTSAVTPPIATGDNLALIPASKKILSDKVLTAIALERVTGRKPDPRRFIEVR